MKAIAQVLEDPHARRRRPEPSQRRSHQPVHRDSRMSGAWEDRYIRPMTWLEADDLRRAAQRFDRAGKKSGDRRGPIGALGLQLLDELVRMSVNFRGRVFPSLEMLAGRLKCAKSTVVEYLRRLADFKIVEWARRLEPADGEWERGPQVRQLSNLYRIALPKLLRKYVRRAPAPADEASRKAAMLAQLDAYARSEAGEAVDAAIARGTARAEARRHRKERESDEPSQTAPESGEEGVRVPRTGPLRAP